MEALKTGTVEEEVKALLNMGFRNEVQKSGRSGKSIDHSNLSSVVNYLHCVGLISDGEKKGIQRITQQQEKALASN